MNGSSFERVDGARRWTVCCALIAVIGGLGSGGCGGGGGSPSSAGSPTSGGGPATVGPIQPTSPNVDSGSVTVTVRDVFGHLVRGAKVSLYFSRDDGTGANIYETTDAKGIAGFSDFPSARITAYAHDDSVVYAFGSSPSVLLPQKGHVDLAITVRPTSDFASIGVGPALVEADAIAEDGHSLTLTLRLIGMPSFNFDHGDFDDGDGDSIALVSCVPDAANDAPAFRADCIKGAAGFDAGYGGENSGEPSTITTISGESTAFFSAALLLDRSDNLIAGNWTHELLFDSKYFLTTKHAADRVVLAAFAADATASGKLSSLPQQPVSIFPIENPQFTTSASELFPLIDSLEQLQGGAAPLYASIDRMLDFTAANAPLSTRRAVVVVTGGQDDTCGTPAQCEIARQALIEKSRATGIAIVAIRLAGQFDHADQIDNHALSELTEGSGGAMLWVSAYGQLGTVFGALSGVLDGTANVVEARFRIRSSTDRAFQSGRTVLGTVRFETCPWDCATFDVPFAVRIP